MRCRPEDGAADSGQIGENFDKIKEKHERYDERHERDADHESHEAEEHQSDGDPDEEQPESSRGDLRLREARDQREAKRRR